MAHWKMYAIAHSLAAATVLLAVLAMRCVSNERVRGQLLGHASRMTLWIITPIAMVVSTLVWAIPPSKPDVLAVWLLDMTIIWVAYASAVGLAGSRRIKAAGRTRHT